MPCCQCTLSAYGVPLQVKAEGAEDLAKQNGEAEATEAVADEAELEDDEDDDVADEPDIEEEEGAEALLAPAAEQTEQFNEQLKDRLKGNVDRFEEMVQHEEEIRLGDEGWKGRYYKVPHSSLTTIAIMSHVHDFRSAKFGEKGACCKATQAQCSETGYCLLCSLAENI